MTCRAWASSGAASAVLIVAVLAVSAIDGRAKWELSGASLPTDHG